MLNLGPWHKLPLSVRWLKPEYQVEFPTELQPPLHMPIVHGPVKSMKVGKKKSKKGSKKAEEVEEIPEESEGDLLCNICITDVTVSQKVTCLYPKCEAVSHILCLGMVFTKNTEDILPIKGDCPTCGGEEIWGNIIRKKRGCYEELKESEAVDGVYDDDIE